MIETKSAPAGILKVPDGNFAGVFEREVGVWLGGVPVLASGMIGSRQGWLEAPYCPCPAGSTEIASALVPHPARPELHFVPGLSLIGTDGVPDVIRGEETQILGAVGDAPGPMLAVLPGTHSKWVLIEAGKIVWFATFMTGEVFGVLKDHSILGRLMQGERADEAAFRRGLDYAHEGGGRLLKQLFSARTLGLFEQLPSESIAAYLSGLLIGHEIDEALACLDHRPDDVTLIGESALTASYVTALEASGLNAVRAPSDAGARGQFLIARAAGLIG